MWEGASPVPVQIWEGASPVPLQMWVRLPNRADVCRGVAGYTSPKLSSLHPANGPSAGGSTITLVGR